MTNKVFRGFFVCAVLGALLFRVVRLDVRPMHHDEANQAVKFGDLLERGEYRFDPNDHHGPSLYYLTLPTARVAGERTLAELSETTLRLVPALFGAGLLLLLLLLAGGLSREASLAAASLAAVSPAMTYYSRFYIQETLLVFFLAGLIAAGWRYARTRSGWWALAAGVSAGLMYATKETSVILFAGLAAALGLVFLMDKPRARRGEGAGPAGNARGGRNAPAKLRTALHATLFLAAGTVTALLFFTSFFQNPQGLADSVRAIGASFNRAGHPGFHAHPWYYYFQTLAYSKTAGGPVWSEAFLLFLAAAGGIAAFGHDAGKDGSPRFNRFVLSFTVVTAVAYSLVPYKTPWNILPFYLGLVILAGNGVGLLLRISRFRLIKILILAALVPGFVNLTAQAYRANFTAPSDPANPYVYAQTIPDFLKLVAAVEKAAAEAPEKKGLLIKVIAPAEETWPLPWYLRGYSRVGYWTSAETAGDPGDAAVVIASAANVEKVATALGDRYQQSFYGLRPEVVLSLFVRRDLWDELLKSRPPISR